MSRTARTAFDTPSTQHSGETDALVAGNARLTAMAGVLLLVLLALEGLTIVRIRPLLPWHVLLGFALMPPVVLKLVSTGHRAVRYYAGDPRYRAAGPPRPLLRLIAPIVVATSVGVLATGVELWFQGNTRVWVHAHQLLFVTWFFAMTVHVLGYSIRAPRLTLQELAPSTRLPGGLARQSLVIASLVLGVALALALATQASPFVLSLR